VVLLTGTSCIIWRANRADPNAIFRVAEQAYRSGRYIEAKAALKRLALQRPPTAGDGYLRAMVAVGLGRDQDALVELAGIPDDHPLAPLAQLRRGQAEIRLGRARPAESAFLAAIQLLPRAVQPHKELVYIYNIQHRQAELDGQLGALLELNVLDFQLVLHWTKTRNTVWNPSGDLPSLEKFVAADPADRWSRLALVAALRRLNRLDEAERALAALPHADADVRACRIQIAMDRGDFAAAESALVDGPKDNAELARLGGQLALQRRDGRLALEHFRVALDAEPTDRVALAGMATALRLVGQPDAAQPFLESAARHDQLWQLVARAATTEGERDPKIPHQLGLACAAAGRQKEARAWLRLAIQRDPLDAVGQQVLFELEHGTTTGSDAQSRIQTYSTR
jgi:predicted Zn-dependent protease